MTRFGVSSLVDGAYTVHVDVDDVGDVISARTAVGGKLDDDDHEGLKSEESKDVLDPDADSNETRAGAEAGGAKAKDGPKVEVGWTCS